MWQCVTAPAYRECPPGPLRVNVTDTKKGTMMVGNAGSTLNGRQIPTRAISIGLSPANTSRCEEENRNQREL